MLDTEKKYYRKKVLTDIMYTVAILMLQALVILVAWGLYYVLIS